MKRIFEYGGVIAGAVPIVFGVVAIAMRKGGRLRRPFLLPRQPLALMTPPTGIQRPLPQRWI